MTKSSKRLFFVACCKIARLADIPTSGINACLAWFPFWLAIDPTNPIRGIFAQA